MMSKGALLKNISDEDEKKIFAKALDKAELADRTGSSQFSDFMDPYKAYKLRSLCSGFDLKVILYGGYDEAERLRVGFFPAYAGEDCALFPISYLEISYNGKYSRNLTHRDFLGSVLGLGITREKVGDICIDGERAVVIADSEIADYIAANLERVGHTKVNVKLIGEFCPKPKECAERKFTVASLRADAVLSTAFNMSRGKAAELIKGGKAYINWKPVASVSENVKENDVVTLRGYGRLRIKDILGKTKKDRLLLNAEIYGKR